MIEPLIFAYYLPQFYPMKLNSLWWGEGFTEWNALVRAQRGWRSPADTVITPGELGFYDLRSSNVRLHQGALAREYGIDAFAVYHYYSAGERVLNEVVDALLMDGQPDHPFFFCWANHDWTLAWKGRPDTVTWRQHYQEGENDRHIDWLLDAFSQERYLKFDNRPVMQVYDILALPNPKAVMQRWRERARAYGYTDLFLLGVAQADHPLPAAQFGLDAWVQGAAPGLRLLRRSRITETIHSATGAARFARFRDTRVPRGELAAAFRKWREQCSERVAPMVVATWNNVGRRDRRAWYLAVDPREFEKELHGVLKDSQPVGSSPLHAFVFINAWNEWGEGMAVEPSVECGREYLEAIRSARELSQGVRMGRELLQQ